MIDILKSIFNSIYGVIRWFVSSLRTMANAGKMMSKIYLFLGDFLYLIPGFLISFAVLFMVIYIVNRLLNGRN